MYESYFGLWESPFENNLDHRFLFISDDHKEVLAALSYFIKSKKGFAIVCGDVGTGKTMLINSFLNTLPEYVQPIIVANPGVSSLELLRYIAKNLKIVVGERDGILELTDAVKELLQKAKSLNKQFVLIIDEAHLLSDQALEEIRLLSNIETQDQKLLQILLVGQYELSYKLDRPEMRHLRQRININRFLSPMNSSETVQYVDHRLKRVGSSFSARFTGNCASAIYKLTGGVPRNINQLCDNALLICMSEARHKVDRRMLRKAQEALLTDRLFTPRFVQRTSAQRRRLPSILLWTAGCLTFLALGITLSQTYMPGKMGQRLSREISPLTGSIAVSKSATAFPTGSVEDKLAGPSGQESSSPVATPAEETSQNSVHPQTVLQTLSPETSGPANLTPANQQEVKEPAAAPPKVLASTTGESRESGTVAKKAAFRDLSSLPGQPPQVAESIDRLAPVQPSDASSDTTLKPALLRWEVKKGETLSIIASKVYRGSEEFGIEAVLLNNPGIKNRDLIHPGQVVFLPRIIPNTQIVHRRDNLFYAYYGHCDSAYTLKNFTSLLEQKGVRYTIIENHSRRGAAPQQILLGGYATVADLQKALDLAKGSKD